VTNGVYKGRLDSEIQTAIQPSSRPFNQSLIHKSTVNQSGTDRMGELNGMFVGILRGSRGRNQNVISQSGPVLDNLRLKYSRRFTLVVRKILGQVRSGSSARHTSHTKQQNT
jgi:hypothetical protein